MKNLAFIYSGDETGLQPLSTSRAAIGSVLSSQNKWQKLINKNLSSLECFKKDLENYKDEEIEDFFFYFIGHGTYMGADNSFYMRLINEDCTPQHVINIVFSMLNPLPRRISFVFDACFSGKVVTQVNKWNKGIEIVTSSLGDKPSSSISPDGKLTLFTHFFCKAINEGSKITLDEISSYINNKVNSQESLYDSTIGRDGRMKIGNALNIDKKENLKSIQKNLKNLIELSALRNYSNNLLSTYLNHVNLFEMDFDEIVEHLYDLRQPLLCLLHNLDSDILENDFKALKLEFMEYSTEACCSYDKMSREQCNLLLTFEPIDDDISRTQVRIWEYQEPYPVEKRDIIVDLSTKRVPFHLVDVIFEIVNVSQEHVLLEFMLPYELINIDIKSWENSEGKSLLNTFNLVRRIYERMEKCRDHQGKLKSWESYWRYYKKKKNEQLMDGVLAISKNNHDDIDFYELQDRPYVRVEHELDSITLYKKIIDESASIVLAPIEECKELDTLCIKLKEEKLGNLVDRSFRIFRKKVPYVLIWDNPKRVIRNNIQITGE